MSIMSRIKDFFSRFSSTRNFLNSISKAIAVVNSSTNKLVYKDINLKINNIEINISKENDVTIKGIRVLHIQDDYLFIQTPESDPVEVENLINIAKSDPSGTKLKEKYEQVAAEKLNKLKLEIKAEE